MPNFRRKAEVFANLTSLTGEQYQRIRAAGATDGTYWNSQGDDADLIKGFRNEVKTHYYYRQLRMCCYCSKEFDKHQATYDAEHILDKDTYPQFMFEFTNLANSCKACNGAKGGKPALISEDVPAAVPGESGAYSIVHPHLDEWDDHLKFDPVGRIVAKDGSTKGDQTIRVCGIRHLNSARLADHFAPGDNQAAEKALEGYFRVTSPTWKRKYLQILRRIADDYDLAAAKTIVDLLDAEIN